ncbi:MAG TPA: hypothetical protein VGF67_02925 [Ktedonobacteraceae bacterium]
MREHQAAATAPPTGLTTVGPQHLLPFSIQIGQALPAHARRELISPRELSASCETRPTRQVDRSAARVVLHPGFSLATPGRHLLDTLHCLLSIDKTSNLCPPGSSALAGWTGLQAARAQRPLDGSTPANNLTLACAIPDRRAQRTAAARQQSEKVFRRTLSCMAGLREPGRCLPTGEKGVAL